MGLNSELARGSLDVSPAHRARGSEWSGGGGRGGRTPRAARPIAAVLHAERLRLHPGFSSKKRTFSSSSKITMLKDLKKANKPLVLPCQWMLIIPGILLSSGLSSSIIPPEISWVVLIMFVPFLSALVISRVPLGWGKGHGTKVASLKRLCFPCAGIKLMAQQSPEYIRFAFLPSPA